MKISINDNRKISTIQDEFQQHFPFLKIEFFSKPHKSGMSSSKKLMKSATKLIGECRSIHVKGAISITPQMTVAELENKFYDSYGLSVQVFRKSGNAWLVTSVTDKWTLEQQNTIGEELSEIKNEA